MKKAIFILIFATLTASAQGAITFSVLQDVRLGMGMDKAHGNDIPTMDIVLNMDWEGNQMGYYYFSVQSQYERANLQSGYYSRYGVNVLWNFNRLIVERLKIGIGAGLNMIERTNTGGLGSYSGTVEVSYPINGLFDVIAKNEWVRRPDLLTPKLGYNLYLGLKIKPFN